MKRYVFTYNLIIHPNLPSDQLFLWSCRYEQTFSFETSAYMYALSY